MAPIYSFKLLLMVCTLIAIAVLYFVWQWLDKMKYKQQQEKIIGKKKKGRNSKLFKLYQLTSDFFITKKFVRRLVSQYELRMPADYKGAREEAMKSALLLWGISLTAVVTVCVVGASFYTVSCVVLFVVMFSGDYVILNLERWDLELISQLDIFVDEVRHYFFETEDVAESLKRAGDESRLKLMKQHAKKLYDVVTSDNIIEAAKKYNQTTNDIYLKRFLASCATVAQYGDKIVDDESLFLSSIRDLKNDILIEKIRRRSVKSKFSGASVISYIPYFVLGWLANFGSGSFEILGDIYGGTYGAIAAVIIFVWAVIAHTVVNTLENAPQIDTDSPMMLQRIYKFKLMRIVVDRILRKNWGKTLRTQSTLRKTGSNLTVQLYTTKRIVLFLLALICSIIFMIGLRAHNRAMYVNNLTGITNTTSGASDEVYLQMYWLTVEYVGKYKDYNIRADYNLNSGAPAAMDYDSDVQEYLASKIAQDLMTQAATMSEEEAYTRLQEFLEEFSGTSLAIINLAEMDYNTAASSQDGIIRNAMSVFRKIYKKILVPNCLSNQMDKADEVAEFSAERICKSRKQYFRWYDLLMSFLFAVAIYYLPELITKLTKKSLQMQMQDEVIQFESVILVLMYIDRMTVEEILTWMAMFSRVFKKSLQTCICYFPVENENAIDMLSEREPFEPFSRLVQNLKVCDRVGVQLAFNGLSSERKNYQELRKQENEITVARNSTIAQKVSMGTVYVVIALYLLVPFAIGAISELVGSLTALSTISAS